MTFDRKTVNKNEEKLTPLGVKMTSRTQFRLKKLLNEITKAELKWSIGRNKNNERKSTEKKYDRITLELQSEN